MKTTTKKESPEVKTHRGMFNVGGRLHEIVTVYDLAGNILHKAVVPLKIKFYAKDFVQIIVGSTLLAVPVSLTEEVWRLGAELPTRNIIGIGILSLFFIGIFVYYSFYREHFRFQWPEFLKRSFAMYAISFFVVGLLLTLLDKAPWSTDWVLALKRVTIVAFPASMSAAVANMIS